MFFSFVIEMLKRNCEYQSQCMRAVAVISNSQLQRVFEFWLRLLLSYLFSSRRLLWRRDNSRSAQNVAKEVSATSSEG